MLTIGTFAIALNLYDKNTQLRQITLPNANGDEMYLSDEKGGP